MTEYRWIMLAILAAALATSAGFRRRARVQGGTIPRKNERGLFIALRLAATLPLFGALVAHIAAPDWMVWATFGLPSWLRWMGILIGLLSLPAMAWTLRTLGPNVSETVLTKPNHELVTRGPYNWVRHPLYTCGLALLVANGLMAASWFLLLYSLVVLILMRLVIIPAEESALADRFGDRYRQYRKQTGCLLPKLPVR